MCWPLADTENFRRTREKPLVPRVGKRSPRLRILEIPGGRGAIKNPRGQKILRGGGGGRLQIKESSVEGYRYFNFWNHTLAK